MNKLIIQELSFERNNHLLFSGINCSLQAGELLQISGTNGSGKSTLLRILAGYLEPLHGTITWQNESIFAQDDYQPQLHYLGHQNGIKPYLTVDENCRHYCALARHKTAIDSILNKMGLSAVKHQPALRLSAGQLRRLALARLLMKSTRLWILDEPTTALDVDGQHLFAELVQHHLTQGGIAILSSHQDLHLPSTQQLRLGKNHE
jgi:heme exporter protein A